MIYENTTKIMMLDMIHIKYISYTLYVILNAILSCATYMYVVSLCLYMHILYIFLIYIYV